MEKRTTPPSLSLSLSLPDLTYIPSLASRLGRYIYPVQLIPISTSVCVLGGRPELVRTKKEREKKEQKYRTPVQNEKRSIRRTWERNQKERGNRQGKEQSLAKEKKKEQRVQRSREVGENNKKQYILYQPSEGDQQQKENPSHSAGGGNSIPRNGVAKRQNY